MKKLLIVLAFASVSMSSMAQDADPTLKYSVATNSFWCNWFVQANFNWSAFYSSQEHGSGLATSPFKSFRSAPNFSVALGKWFTPGIGLRTKFYGVWNRKIMYTEDKNEYKYWDLQEQVLLNLSNLFCGYSDTRVWNLTLFAGAGAERDMTDNQYGMAYSLGLMNQWRLSNHWAINLELGWLVKEHNADAVEDYVTNSRIWDQHDNQLYAEVGLTWNISKTTGWNKVPDVDAIKALSQAQIDALNAQLADANAENARLKALLANQKPAPAPEPQIIKEYAGTPVSVFFNLDKWNIASQKDLVNVKGIAEYAKENNANLLVTGYADSDTGTPDHNQTLSEKRAESVANELVNMGVSRDNIETVGKGGVNDLSPVSYNRRATVEVK